MATVFSHPDTGATDARGYRADQAFFTRLAITLTVIVVIAFAQFALRGFVDPRTAPLRLHVHGVVMLSWMALFIAQNRLAETGQIALHRQFGRVGAVLALIVGATISYAGIAAVREGSQPPFFTAPYFLALSQFGGVFFLLIVFWAVSVRRNTQWHRRLMFASFLTFLGPAFGRMLPMPLIMPWGQWVILVIQLAFFALIARHDRKVLGAVHPATLAGAAVITIYHVVVEVCARTALFERLVLSLQSGS